MKKGLLITLVMALVLAIAVPVALAITDNQKAELDSLYEQQHQLRLQILDKQVEAGLVDSEDAQSFRERMQEQWELHQQRLADGDYSFGFGRRGGGGGFGRRNGGCGNCLNRPEL
jgi:hypothetical protein